MAEIMFMLGKCLVHVDYHTLMGRRREAGRVRGNEGGREKEGEREGGREGEREREGRK